MKNLIPVILLGFIAPSAFASLTPECECKKVAGVWENIDSGTGIRSQITVPANCKGITLEEIGAKERSELQPDSIYCANGEYRMQYKFLKGSPDDIYPNPLPAEIAAQLQGFVELYGPNKISFGLDSVCTISEGHPCKAAKFNRVR